MQYMEVTALSDMIQESVSSNYVRGPTVDEMDHSVWWKHLMVVGNM